MCPAVSFVGLRRPRSRRWLVVFSLEQVHACDPAVIAACVRRPVRFVMDHRIYAIPVLHFIFRTMRAIPIASGREDPALKESAFAEASSALAAGEIVCIFPEGRITDTGELNAFRPGLQRILERTPVPVVPMALRGLWGSFFSRSDRGRSCRARSGRSRSDRSRSDRSRSGRSRSGRTAG